MLVSRVTLGYFTSVRLTCEAQVYASTALTQPHIARFSKKNLSMPRF